MNLYFATEECPGCGLFFETTPELTKVDFNGEQFKPDLLDEE